MAIDSKNEHLLHLRESICGATQYPRPWVRTGSKDGKQLWRHATDAEIQACIKENDTVHLSY